MLEERDETNNHEASRELVIQNRLGLHARAAAALVKVTQGFDSDVQLEKGDDIADAKSILSLISLECPIGTRVTVRANGLDSDSLIEAVARLVEDKFGEE